MTDSLRHGIYLAMDEPSVPWIYVAMVFIAFLHWLVTQFKRAAEKRRAMRRFRRGEIPHPDYRPPVAREEEEEDMFTEIIRQVRELETTESTEQSGKRRKPVPPPIPGKGEARKRGSEREKLPAIPKDSPILKGEIGVRRRKSSSKALLDMLGDRGKVRQAVILKEVLDKPKGL